MIPVRKTVNLLDIPVDSITMNEALERIVLFLSTDKTNTIFTPNAEIMMAAHTDPYLKKILCESDMLVADGAGVVLASKILGCSVPEKVSGIDLVRNSFNLLLDKKIKYFLFGAKPGVAETAKEEILSQYSNVEIVGCRDGYFSNDDVESIIVQINQSGADILLVALGAPKQEIWIYENMDKINVKVCIGVGGSFDVFAGTVKLAPEFFRRNGLEWLYRLYKEPWRFKRMLNLPKYILTVIYTKLLGKNN